MNNNYDVMIAVFMLKVVVEIVVGLLLALFIWRVGKLEKIVWQMVSLGPWKYTHSPLGTPQKGSQDE